MRARFSTFNHLGAWRVYRGYKQTELGRLLGVSHALISQWERGILMPDSTQIAKLCYILRCSKADLFPKT